MEISTSPDDLDRVARSVTQLAGRHTELLPVLGGAATPPGAGGDPVLDDALDELTRAWSAAVRELAADAAVLLEQLRTVDARYADAELRLTAALAASRRHW